MALFDKQLDLITEDDLLSLVENQVREGYQIEYKRSVLRESKEKQDKVDFLASVTSFANTIGGVPTHVRRALQRRRFPKMAGIRTLQEKELKTTRLFRPDGYHGTSLNVSKCSYLASGARALPGIPGACRGQNRLGIYEANGQPVTTVRLVLPSVASLFFIQE
jgi:hypothetical protein